MAQLIDTSVLVTLERRGWPLSSLAAIAPESRSPWLVKQHPDVLAAVPPQAVNATSMNTAMIQRRSMMTSLVDLIPHRRR